MREEHPASGGDRNPRPAQKTLRRAPMAAAPAAALTVWGSVLMLLVCCDAAFPALSGLGSAAVLRYALRQAVFAVGGLGVMVLCAFLPVTVYRSASPVLLTAAVLGLAAELFFGSVTEGGDIVLAFGPVSLDFTELLFFALALFLPDMLCRRQDVMRRLRAGLAPFAVFAAALMVLLAFLGDYTAVFAVYAFFALLVFLGGGRIRWMALSIPLGIFAAVLFFRWVPAASAFVGRWEELSLVLADNGAPFSAFSNGGLAGLGLGCTGENALQLVTERGAYVFSAVCEQTGFIGGALLLLVYAVFVLGCGRITACAVSRYSYLAGAALTLHFAGKLFLHLSICANLFPAAGVCLPFVGTGGADMLLELAETGVLMSIARETAFSRDN